MNAVCEQSEEMYAYARGEAVEGGIYAFRTSEVHSYPGIYVSPHWKDLCYFLRLDMEESNKPSSKKSYRRMEDLLELEQDAADVSKFYCKLVPQHSPESKGMWDLARAVPEIVSVTRLQKIPGFEFKCEDLEQLCRFLNRSKKSRYSRTSIMYGHHQSYDDDLENPKAVKEAVVGRFYGARLCVTELPKGKQKQKPRPCLVMRIFGNKDEPGKVLVLPVTSFSSEIEGEFQTLETVFEKEIEYASKYFIPLEYPSDSGKALASNSECTRVLVAPRLKNDEGYICACEYEMEVKTLTLLDDPDLDLVDGKYKCRSEVNEGGFHQVCEVVRNIPFDGHGTLRSGGQSGSQGVEGRRGGGNHGASGSGNRDGSGGGNLYGGGGGNPCGRGGGHPCRSGGGNPCGSKFVNPRGSGVGNPSESGVGNWSGSGGGNSCRSGGGNSRRSRGGNPDGSGGGNRSGSGSRGGNRSGSCNPRGSGGGNRDGSGGGNPDGSGGGNPGGSGRGNPDRSGGGNPSGSGGGNPGGSGGGNPGGSGGGNSGGSGGDRQGRLGRRGGGGRGGRRRQHGKRQSGRNIHEKKGGVSEQEDTGGVRKIGRKRGNVGGSEGGKETEINHLSNYQDQVYELIEDLGDLDWSWDGVSPWLPICNQQTGDFPHGFATNVTQTLDKRVLERLNQHMEYHNLENGTPILNLQEVNEGVTSKFPLETLLDSSFEMLIDLIDTEDIETEILHEVIEDLMKIFEDLVLKEEVNSPISKDELEIVLKREGKISWNIIDDDLVECIKWDDVECFNQGGDHTFSNALRQENWDNDDSYLECDDDEDEEKFLLKLCFWTNVKVTQLIVKSPLGKGPTTLELFVNKPHMGYGDKENVTQIIELTPENLEGMPVKLEARKFQSVESLQVCAKGLKRETAQVTKFALIGSTKETTDASKLKRQCSMAYVLTQFGDSIK